MSGVILLLIVMALLVFRQSIIVILFVATAYVHMVYGDGVIEYLIDDCGPASTARYYSPFRCLSRRQHHDAWFIAERLIAIMRALTQ